MLNSIEPFDPNSQTAAEVETEKSGHAVFPVYGDVYTVDQYHQVFARAIGEPVDPWVQRIVSKKALSLPPEMQSFIRLNTIPEDRAGNLIHWPGIPPEALRKIARENLAPQMIISMRCSDVARYSELSTHVWKPGWEVSLRSGTKEPTTGDLQAIREAERFLLNCNIETHDARKRDASGLTGFSRFLGALVRDSLTFDGMAVWTDMDRAGRIKGFKALSAYNIRLAGPGGYRDDPNVYACAVDEMGKVVAQFTRDELIWYVRNPRADPDVCGYGYPEIEVAIRLIQGFQNALDMNVDTFQRNSIPNGFLTVSGRWTQKQLDVLSRIWLNLKRGVTKSWSIPVIALPDKGEIKINNLMDLKGAEVFYQDLMNMVMGAFCTVYCFPTTRLGYRISGQGPDSHPRDQQTSGTIIDETDPGLMPLLHSIECLINEYILATRWPELAFHFNGKNPKEDAREYEARTNAMTLDEHRAMSDLPNLEGAGKDEKEKAMLRLMGATPYNPAMAGVWQSIIAASTTKEVAEEKNETAKETAVMAPPGGTTGIATPGAPHPPKKDPANAAAHGHTAGVRRDSAKEKG